MINRIADDFRSGYWLVPLLWMFVVLAFSHYFGEAYSPDSYYYYLLGKSVFAGNGYLTSVIRENLPDASFYSMSYPPVMPLLCGFADWLFHKGIASGLIVDLAVLYGIFHVCYLLGRKIHARFFYLPLVICFLFVLTSIPFAEELIAGRSIPVATLLFLTLLYLSVTTEGFSRGRYMMIGCCLGLLYLTRFDTALFCFGFPVFYTWIRKDRWQHALFIYAGILFIMTPWLIRNILTFGRPFVSSNAVAVMSVYNSDCPTLLFFEHGIPSGITHPDLWLKQRLLWLCRNIMLVYYMLVPFKGISLLGGAAVVALITAGILSARDNRPVFIFIAASLLWLLLDIATVSITRLPDARYFAIVVLLLLLGAGFGALSALDTKPAMAESVIRQKRGLSGIFALVVVTGTFYSAYPQIEKDPNIPLMSGIYSTFAPFIKQGELVASYGYADNFSYYTGWKMIYFPPNVSSPSDTDFIAWKKHFHVSYILMTDTRNFATYPGTKILARSGHFVLIDIKEGL